MNVETPWKQHLMPSGWCTGIDLSDHRTALQDGNFDSVAVALEDVLVVCERGHVVPSFHIHKPAFDGVEHIARCRIEDVPVRHTGVMGGRTTFSPCGSLLLVLVRDSPTC